MTWPCVRHIMFLFEYKIFPKGPCIWIFNLKCVMLFYKRVEPLGSVASPKPVGYSGEACLQVHKPLDAPSSMESPAAMPSTKAWAGINPSSALLLFVSYWFTVTIKGITPPRDSASSLPEFHRKQEDISVSVPQVTNKDPGFNSVFLA